MSGTADAAGGFAGFGAEFGSGDDLTVGVIGEGLAMGEGLAEGLIDAVGRSLSAELRFLQACAR